MGDLHLFKTYRNRLNRILNKVRNEYFINDFEWTKWRSDLVWEKKLNSLITNYTIPRGISPVQLNGVQACDQNLADEFNKYFVGLSCDRDVDNDLNHVPLLDKTIYLKRVNEVEVMAIFAELKNSTSCDIDGLQIRPIRWILDIILPYINHTINLYCKCCISLWNARCPLFCTFQEGWYEPVRQLPPNIDTSNILKGIRKSSSQTVYRIWIQTSYTHQITIWV